MEKVDLFASGRRWRRVSHRTLEFIRGVLFLRICGGIEPGRKTDWRMAGVALYAVSSGQCAVDGYPHVLFGCEESCSVKIVYRRSNREGN
jgi:hypothetical protein